MVKRSTPAASSNILLGTPQSVLTLLDISAGKVDLAKIDSIICYSQAISSGKLLKLSREPYFEPSSHSAINQASQKQP